MHGTRRPPMDAVPAMPPHHDRVARVATPIPLWATLLGPGYRRLGLALPRMVRLPPSKVPHPYHGLLVHSNDMTPTLERFYGARLRLLTLSRERSADTYWREVILELECRGRPVEYGAIGIHLQHLPPPARERVLEEQHPFGRILQLEAIAHLSWPQAFFAVRSDAHLSRLLGSRPDEALYGRRNVLVDGHRRLLAEVLEIVAPAPASPALFHEPAPHPFPLPSDGSEWRQTGGARDRLLVTEQPKTETPLSP
jgi:chorismate-pyruvate lyase